MISHIPRDVTYYKARSALSTNSFAVPI